MGGGKYVGWWGNLGGEVKGVVTYAIAPNKQRAYAGAVDGIKYMLTKRIWGIGYVAAGLLPWYLAYQYTADRYVMNQRKDPNDTSYNRKRGY
ncbi:hypothetical protein MIR68_001728 [Amoeboaphelidium protococcarum]|nr:hypothetical protein MIR68_001728 [Amoeboaphelidium protococcarum]